MSIKSTNSEVAEVLLIAEKSSGNRKKLIKTEHLMIREMVQSAFDALCKILCDEEVIHTAYGSTFILEKA